MSQPEGEDKLRTGHEQLGGKALEEGGGTFVLHHVGNDPEAALGVVKIPVLDSSLDNVERGRDDKGSTGTSNGCDKVLAPCGAVVVGQLVEIFFRRSRSTEQLFKC